MNVLSILAFVAPSTENLAYRKSFCEKRSQCFDQVSPNSVQCQLFNYIMPHPGCEKAPTEEKETELVFSPFPDSADIQDSHLIIGGIDTINLVEEWRTPLYLYDLATIQHRCRAYVQAVKQYYPGNARIAYASKAYLCTALAQVIRQEGLDLDVVSGGELYVAQQAEFPRHRVHCHGNGKTESELAQAIDAGIGTIVIDSLQEMDAISRLAAARRTSVRAWIRISPDIDVHTHPYRKTGILDSKFGFPIRTGMAMQALREAIHDPRIELVGLHAHIGSQIVETEPFVRTVEALVELGAQAQQLGFRLEELSPGGGLAIPYKTDSRTPRIDDHVRRICTALVQSCEKAKLPLPTLVLEPGRSIVGTAGVALYRVLARKEIPGVRTYVSVDGGIGDNPRPALYQAAYTALLANKADRPPTEMVTIAGRFCESGDVLVREVNLDRAEPGDIIAVPASGAYQLSMSSNYNLVPHPAVVLVDNGKARLIVRRETYEDLVRRDMPLNLEETRTTNDDGQTRQ